MPVSARHVRGHPNSLHYNMLHFILYITALEQGRGKGGGDGGERGRAAGPLRAGEHGAPRGDRLEALYVLAVATGLRQGELLALRWCDIDLPARTLTVQRNLVQLNGRLEITEPKTAASRRRVDLPCVAVAALEAHRRRRPAAPHPTAFVFADAKGGPIRKQNLVRRSFRPLLGRAGLPRIRFHDLRHTAATLLLAEGVHPKIVAERLGHSSVTITLDTYSHVLKGMQREAASKLDVLLAAGRDGAHGVNAGIAPTVRVTPPQ